VPHVRRSVRGTKKTGQSPTIAFASRRGSKGDALLKKQWKQIVIVPRIPDFLSRLVALSSCMRLSLKKAAHVVLSGAA
jgi:uncharacterized protein YqcC (DUF446 family)